MEFTTLENPEQEIKAPENIESEQTEQAVNDLFAGFPEPSETENLTPTENATNQSVSEQISTEWRGNPAYFQTGKKAGQLKPSAKISVSEPAKALPINRNESLAQTEPPKGMLLDGALLMTLTDIAVPAIVSVLHNFFTKENKVTSDELKLSDAQRRDFKEVFDKSAEYLKIHIPPVYLLLVTVGGAYAGNLGKAKASKK